MTMLLMGAGTAGSAVATHFAVSAATPQVSGVAFNFTVTALSAGNATVAGYTGSVTFTSTDGSATLPANHTLTSGVGTFSATLKTAGTKTLTATDTVTTSITGTSGNITVSPALPTPPPLLTGLAFWPTAEAGVYTSPGVLCGDGDPVSEWSDGRNTSYADTTYPRATFVGTKPIYKTNILNGKPAILFDSVAQLALTLARPQPHTVAFVAKCTDATGPSPYYCDSDVNAAAVIDATTTLLDMYAGNFIDSTTLVANAWRIAVCLFSGASSDFRVNAVSSGVQDVGSGSGTTMTIGGTVGLAGPGINGYIAEMPTYTAGLSLGNRQALETYLNAKYAVY